MMDSMMPVFLWTDIMIWGLFILIVMGIVQILHDPQKRAQWHSVFQSKTAMVSVLVLLVYFSIALLDSVHFKNTPDAQDVTNSNTHKELISVLDMGLEHLIQNTERTYSAPFALHEYSSTVVYGENGQVQQVYLPLKHVAQHIDMDKSLVTYDVLTQIVWALMGALSLLMGIAIFHSYFYLNSLARQTAEVKQQRLPWGMAYLTLFSITFIGLAFYILSFDYHVLGTNKVGEDVLYQSLKSIRTGVLIGGLTTVVMLPLALLLGISAGYFKGWIDDVIQYLYTTLNSIPGVLLIAAAVLVMQSIMSTHADWFGSTEERADMRLLFLILILGMTSWTGLCRLLRAETLKISQIEYVTAAKAFGLKPFTIIRRHVFPNLVHLILIALVLDFSGLVLAEAVLSYVGVGVDPTMPSWGNMINQARLEMAREPMVWWSLVSAFIFMFILVLAANLFADRVQWVLNPRSEK
ncbi:peptide ABC transporter permease [Thiomicrorhabdus immobilis]|uniref:Peptide ABC transporter permease n=1 Tax=Thiomicrorhabdus immobilis TaxID=2791037 RepID=A0ABM7MD38_9GAMM|nr:ABC transporter permease [Thiomicrorhabdus immobilis]BCN93332.1 peptide ABC transporter permease [Thiomicrorhabdus immobilis]